MDLTIEGNIYTKGSFQHCCIGIENGKIKAVKKILKSDRHVNIAKRLVLPAGIDIHVHFRDPGLTHKDDFHTGSISAAFGGITCVYDMPNTRPECTTTKNLDEKINNAKKKSIIDFGVYAGVTNRNIEDIPELSKHCNGFKIYLGGVDDVLLLDEKSLHEACRSISHTGKPVLIHAESRECLNKHKQKERNLEDHIRSHHAECEESAVKKIIDTASNTNAYIHVCHLSSCEGFEHLTRRSTNLSVGVTPHHLLLTIDNIKDQHGYCKVNPPIRTRLDRDTLWQGVTTGMIDIIESDHAPHTKDEKNMDFDKVPSGIPGVETMYPLLLAAVKHDRLSIQRLISLICEKPAKLLSINKGRIEPGYDADLIIVNLKNVELVDEDKLHYKCGWTPFQGWPAIFPEDVILRGGYIIENREIQVKSGYGRYIEDTHHV
ncbi:MAG: dihydroorotase [Candidatus Thermoplasmatota archaeon]